MKDLKTIEQLESILKIKMIETKSTRAQKGYAINAQGYVTSINLTGSNILNLDDIAPLLNKFSHLEHLDLSYNKLSDFHQLEKLQTLKSLNLSSNKYVDITSIISLKQLTHLFLNRNKVTNISSLEKLENLTALYLYRTRTNDLSTLHKLNNLTILDLGANQFKDLYLLKDLTNIKELYLSKNELTDIKALKNLKHLSVLDLSYNQITTITALKELKELTELILLSNKITSINSLQYLQLLKKVNLARNKITNITPLKKISNLRSLWLLGNTISQPHLIESLINLDSLSLGKTELTNISFLQKLINLKRLDLQDNNITDISTIRHLPNLKIINLRGNSIKEIPDFQNLKLTNLQLQRNPIINLPSWITDLNLEIVWDAFGYGKNAIVFHENPIKSPPIEVLKQGGETIKRYFEKISEEGVDYIFEAKLTLVGDGSAGKTSLQKRLLREKAALPQKDKRTRGIEIKDWQFKKEKGKKHIAHIWDFGGQDVYYPVHRFFITENSVFVLLASTRQNQHNFDYWIPTIYQFGGQSPIILGQTCHDGNRIPWNDLGIYISNSNFNIIKNQALPYLELNLPNKNDGLKKIKQAIVSQIINLPHYGKSVPKSWVLVRNFLSEELLSSACITFEKFEEICKRLKAESFTESADVTDCCQFLHDIGVVLWYSQNEELKNWVILQPEWAMNAVYKIIDDIEIQKHRGNIQAKDFTRLWKEPSYENKHPILRKMLEIFKIAFPKKHKQGDYIIPARLVSMPNENRWIDNQPYLRLEYKYEFMPRGLVNQISAELSWYIVSDEEVWNNAVNFSLDEDIAQCQLEEDFYSRKINIKAKGKDARGLLTIVMDALRNITAGYKGVKPEIYVPCTCSKCKSNSKPTSFLYDDLIRWSSDEDEAIVFCNESREKLEIVELLYNVGLSRKIKKKKTKNRTLTLFLASSSELKEDRLQFETLINRENKRLNEEGLFLKLELWEDFIDSMSQTRLQDEYNKTLKKCDIFISLFFTKVGIYTAEEFEVAFGNFKETGKPIIYTYFKDASVNISDITSNINSKLEFERKLKSLGHFPTTYKNVGDLKYHFKMQLDKVLAEL